MTSEINTQAVSINRLIVPSGTGISTDTSPSLPATAGSLATDITNGGLYMGDGTNWFSAGISTGVESGISSDTIFSFQKAGQPSFTGVSVRLAKITVRGRALIMMSLIIEQTITISANGTWVSNSAIIPTDYVPYNNATLYFPITSTTDAGISNTSYVIINNSGDKTIRLVTSAAGTSLGFYTFSCIYQ